MNPKPKLKVRVYPLVRRCVEDGLSFGIRRIFKHVGGTRTEDQLSAQQDVLEDAVMNELCEWINFDDDDFEANPTEYIPTPLTPDQQDAQDETDRWWEERGGA